MNRGLGSSSMAWVCVSVGTCVLWGWQVPFAPVFGDATLGSLATSVSKESGVGDQDMTGSLYKSIDKIVYVDGTG